MIIIRIRGGIGNQLFMYAAARRLSIKSGQELVIDHKSGFSRDFQYQRHYQLDHFNISARYATATERMEPFCRLRRYLRKKRNNSKSLAEKDYLVQKGPDFDSAFLDFVPEKDVYLEGYWQSESYFSDVESTIRQDLAITPPSDSQNLETSHLIQECNAVALHVRFFDGPGEQGVHNASIEYYRNAISLLEEKAGRDLHFFVFSDNHEKAAEKIHLPAERMTLVEHNRGDENAYADLWLMSQCRHFIIANSTFSWWGAWLGSFDGKQVVAPGFSLGGEKMSWGFDGLLPAEWMTC